MIGSRWAPPRLRWSTGWDASRSIMMNDAINDASAVAEAGRAAQVSLGTIFLTFLTAGAISFGGGVVAYLREYTVSDTKWLDDEGFLDALEISQTLPGLNAVNMSVIIGDNLRGIPGAIVAVAGSGAARRDHHHGTGRVLAGAVAQSAGQSVPDRRRGGGGRTVEHGDAAIGTQAIRQAARPCDHPWPRSSP